MSTTPDTAKLVAIGSRFRARYLVQQAGYTLGIAAAEGPNLAALLPTSHLEKTTKLRDDVNAALEDKAIRAAESKHATTLQNEQMHAATVWIRRVGKRCQNAAHLGVAMPADLIRVGSSATVPGMLEQLTRTLALLGEQSAAMNSVGPPTQTLIDEGRTLLLALQQADTTQERARSFDVPAAVETFLAKKGELYIALKIIHNAGHELYAHDLISAAKFNMSILHRRAPSPAEPSPPEPAPPAPA